MTLQDAGIVAFLNKTFLVSCSINSSEENTAPFCSVKTLKRMSHLLVLESFIQIFHLPARRESTFACYEPHIFYRSCKKNLYNLRYEMLRTYYIILSNRQTIKIIYIMNLKVYNIYKSIQAYLIQYNTSIVQFIIEIIESRFQIEERLQLHQQIIIS